jgi:hypothetical protein
LSGFEEIKMRHLISKKTIRLLLASCFVLLFVTVAKAQEIEYVGSYYLGGEFRGIHVDESYAICGMNRGFQILDVSDPEAISPVGDNPFVGHVQGFAVSGTYAYATTYGQDFGSFFIVDIQDVEAPVITAVLDSVGRGQLGVSDDYAYILDYDEPVDIVDISDPYNPQIVGEYVSGSYNYDISISGTYAYLANGDAGLGILDISDPLEPVLVSQYSSPIGERIGEVFVSGAYAYTAALLSGYIHMIEIVDISDPFSPVYVGHYETGWGVRGIFVKGNYLYAFQEYYWDEALFIIVNVEDRENPYIEWSSDFCSIINYLYVFVSDNRAYLTCDYSLIIMDVSDPSSPTELGGYTSSNGLNRIVMSGDHIYGIYEPLNYGLYIFGVSDPTSPKFVTAYNVGDYTGDLTIVEDYVYVAERGFEVIDVSIPESPTFVGEYETGAVRSIDIQGEYAYLSVWASEMQIVNIADPGNPVLVGQCPVEWPWGIFVQDDLAFIARYYDDLGLAIIDISNPHQPLFIGGCEAPGRMYEWVYVQGQYAYVTARYYGVEIIDISDPYNPSLIAYYDTPGFASDIYVNENFAYISDSWEGLIILDVSDPYNPAFVEVYDTPGAARSSCIDGEYIYVADDFSLMVLRFIGGPCDYIPGDCNHNGTPLEISDVLAMIGNYRGMVAPYYICDCGVDPPGSYFAATADPNGNCVANELNDVVIEIAAYRGSMDVSSCPDCPGSGR